VQELKVRVNYVKGDQVRFLSHLDLTRVMRMALRRANWPVLMTQGFSPKMKVSFYSALPVGTAGYDEYMDVVLNVSDRFLGKASTKSGEGSEVFQFLSLLAHSLSKTLPTGVSIKQVFPAEKDEEPFESRILSSLYHVHMRNVDEICLTTAITEFLKCSSVPYNINRRKSTKTIDLREFISWAQIKPVQNLGPDILCVLMEIKHADGRTARPQWVIDSLSEFGLSADSKEVIVNRVKIRR